MIRRMKTDVVNSLPTKCREVKYVHPDESCMAEIRALQKEMKTVDVTLKDPTLDAVSQKQLKNQQQAMLNQLCKVSGLCKVKGVLQELERLIKEARVEREKLELESRGERHTDDAMGLEFTGGIGAPAGLGGAPSSGLVDHPVESLPDCSETVDNMKVDSEAQSPIPARQQSPENRRSGSSKKRSRTVTLLSPARPDSAAVPPSPEPDFPPTFDLFEDVIRPPRGRDRASSTKVTSEVKAATRRCDLQAAPRTSPNPQPLSPRSRARGPSVNDDWQIESNDSDQGGEGQGDQGGEGHGGHTIPARRRSSRLK